MLIYTIIQDFRGKLISLTGSRKVGLKRQKRRWKHILQRPTLSDAYRNKQFQSSHWDEPNVLGHVRFNDRTGPNGEKILHFEEIQSDLHQQGRSKGYRLPSQETTQMDSEYRALVHKNADAISKGETPKQEDVTRAQELENVLIKSDKSKIPDCHLRRNGQNFYSSVCCGTRLRTAMTALAGRREKSRRKGMISASMCQK